MEDIDQFPVQIAGEVRQLDIEKYMDPKEARKVDPFTPTALLQLRWQLKIPS